MDIFLLTIFDVLSHEQQMMYFETRIIPNVFRRLLSVSNKRGGRGWGGGRH